MVRVVAAEGARPDRTTQMTRHLRVTPLDPVEGVPDPRPDRLPRSLVGARHLTDTTTQTRCRRQGLEQRVALQSAQLRSAHITGCVGCVDVGVDLGPPTSVALPGLLIENRQRRTGHGSGELADVHLATGPRQEDGDVAEPLGVRQMDLRALPTQSPELPFSLERRAWRRTGLVERSSRRSLSSSRGAPTRW